MPCPNMDALFYLVTQGDLNAFSDLRDWFVKKAKIFLLAELNKLGKDLGIPLDFEEFYDEIFIKIISDYNEERSSFSHYCYYIFEHKLLYYFLTASARNYSNTFSLDETTEFGNSYLEMVEDSNCTSIGSDIAINNFKYQISSPSSENNAAKRKNRILMLKYAGYKDTEICKILRITPGVYRNLIKNYQNDEDLVNFKLELK